MRAVLTVCCAALLPLAAAAATPRIAVLEVQNMSCSLCPLTVRKALEKTPGVTRARVDYAAKTATVDFDAERTTPEALAAATTQAGYPSTPRRSP